MFEDDNISSALPLIQMLVVLSVSIESEKIDEILKKILEIRQEPKEKRSELTSDFIGELTKYATKEMMKNLEPCGAI